MPRRLVKKATTQEAADEGTGEVETAITNKGGCHQSEQMGK